MVTKRQYYILASGKKVPLAEREGLITSTRGSQINIEPMELVEDATPRKVTGSEKLPEGTVYMQEGEELFTLPTKPIKSENKISGKRPMNKLEQEMVDETLGRFQDSLRYPDDLQKTPLFSALKKDDKTDMVNAISELPEDEKKALTQILGQMRTEKHITPITDPLAKELAKAAKVTGSP